ncbi:hypothetical protein, partial [Frankia sp. Cj3]|uniref:hypothetical protein n=1 Tax=Frankia sp. Cj3 TaxID=2880976 RepID=UPI001EF6E1F6
TDDNAASYVAQPRDTAPLLPVALSSRRRKFAQGLPVPGGVSRRISLASDNPRRTSSAGH